MRFDHVIDVRAFVFVRRHCRCRSPFAPLRTRVGGIVSVYGREYLSDEIY